MSATVRWPPIRRGRGPRASLAAPAEGRRRPGNALVAPPGGPSVAPDLLLVAGARAWRLAAIVLLAAALAGALVAMRLARGGRTLATAPRMALLAHLAELRDRLLWVVGAWLAGTLLAFSVRLEPRPWGALPVPALHDNVAAQAYRALAAHLVPDGVRLIVLRPLDGFSAEFTIAMAIGLAVALPVLLAHGTAFLAPALTAKERRLARVAILPALALFLAGATLAVAVLAPLLLEALYGYSEALGAEPYLLVGELVSFAVLLALVFGLASLTPLVMAGIAATGLAGWRGMLAKWRHAVVAAVVLCALATDGSIVTVLIVAAPLVGLYLLGVALAAWTGRGKGDGTGRGAHH